MGTMMRSTALPRRLTQLFADNKKSYEALVQTRKSGPEASHLHLKLRIQKDRLIAWGIQWSDRSTAAYAGDIDGSLDRAGISDLVASIMCSIRELLDEAEALQPEPQSISLPRGHSKLGLALQGPDNPPEEQWTSANLKRLEGILKDLTTSIDTLCDLSRHRVEGNERNEPPSKPVKHSTKAHGLPQTQVGLPVSPGPSGSMKTKAPRRDSPTRRDDLTDMTYIDPSLLRQPGTLIEPSSSPPSYESIVSGSENRIVAYFSLPSLRRSAQPTSDPNPETPVLLDYKQSSGHASEPLRPDNNNFEELLLGLLKLSTWNVYTGVLKLTGWTVDSSGARCAYVYEIPPFEERSPVPMTEIQPRSLLSFLQYGGDTDSQNMPGLENRYRLALNVALSVMHLHEMNITHQDINSNNLLFFLDKVSLASRERVWKGAVIRKPYLTGFHPRVSGSSNQDVDKSAECYRHPMLAGDSKATFEQAHDYYSLGLILLEIGLWMPVQKFWKSRYKPGDFKARLQDIYLKKLSAKCGDGYMNAVRFCMTAADYLGYQKLPSSSSLAHEGSALHDFQMNVIKPLERCCRIEEDSEVTAAPQIAEPQSEQSLETMDKMEQSIGASSIALTTTGATNDPMRDEVALAASRSKRASKQSLPPPPQKIKVWSHELPALYSKYWASTMFPMLERILKKAISRWESYTIDLFMAGADPDTARPTIYMECTSTGKVRRILRHLNKELRLFEIRVVSGQVVRSKSGKKKRKAVKKKVKGPTGSGELEGKGPTENLDPHYQPQPACGASIGAYLNGAHLPPVTFGGAVLVNGEPFGMSVHHMIEDEEEMEVALDDAINLQRSMAPSTLAPKPLPDALAGLSDQFEGLYPFEVSESAEADNASTASYPCSEYSSQGISDPACPEALYPFEISDEEFDSDDNQEDDDPANDFWLNPNFDTGSVASTEDDDLDCDLGDTDGITPGTSTSFLVTQPAIDDVQEGFFPCLEDASSEHLSSHTLGHIHASSGFRRAHTDTLIHELDWALIKIDPSREPIPPLNQPPCPPPNNNGASLLAAPAPPTTILPSSSLASRAVHSHARSSGAFARGTILPAMRLVRMPGRASPSHSWQVRGSFGAGGDSGAWVLDDRSGALCGHVLAFSERSQVAYIAPMEVMVRDMEGVLGVRVGLPGVEEVEEEGVRRGEGEGRDADEMVRGELLDVDVGDEGIDFRPLRSASPVFPTSPPTMPWELEALVARNKGRDRDATGKGKETASPIMAGHGSLAIA